MRDGKMHQTTVRFGPDLWEAMERECARLGVSVAQYLRESALARLAYTAGRTGSPAYEMALAGAGAGGDSRLPDPAPRAEEELGLAANSLEASILDANAVGAQSRLARARAREVRRHSAELREFRVRRGG